MSQNKQIISQKLYKQLVTDLTRQIHFGNLERYLAMLDFIQSLLTLRNKRLISHKQFELVYELIRKMAEFNCPGDDRKFVNDGNVNNGEV